MQKVVILFYIFIIIEAVDMISDLNGYADFSSIEPQWAEFCHKRDSNDCLCDLGPSGTLCLDSWCGKENPSSRPEVLSSVPGDICKGSYYGEASLPTCQKCDCCVHDTFYWDDFSSLLSGYDVMIAFVVIKEAVKGLYCLYFAISKGSDTTKLEHVRDSLFIPLIMIFNPPRWKKLIENVKNGSLTLSKNGLLSNLLLEDIPSLLVVYFTIDLLNTWTVSNVFMIIGSFLSLGKKLYHIRLMNTVG